MIDLHQNQLLVRHAVLYSRTLLYFEKYNAELLQKIVNSAIVGDHMETVLFAIIAITWFSNLCDSAIVGDHMETRQKKKSYWGFVNGDRLIGTKIRAIKKINFRDFGNRPFNRG